MLGQHPDVRLNPLKEVRYLWESSAFPTEGLARRFMRNGWHNRDYRSYFKERLRYYVSRPTAAIRSPDRLVWDLKFLFGRRSDDWFESMFASDKAKITGDFSPQVSHLPPWDVLRLSREWPDVKILLTLREPVEWSWSFARMSLIQGRELGDITDCEFHDFFLEYATYYPNAGTILIWQRLFAGKFHIIFFDEIVSDPTKVLLDVCNFLGLSTAPMADFGGIQTKSNAGRAIELPERYRRMLIDIHRDQVRLLAELCGSHARQWLERYD
jgi:hypothetical protein